MEIIVHHSVLIPCESYCPFDDAYLHNLLQCLDNNESYSVITKSLTALNKIIQSTKENIIALIHHHFNAIFDKLMGLLAQPSLNANLELVLRNISELISKVNSHPIFKNCREYTKTKISDTTPLLIDSLKITASMESSAMKFHSILVLCEISKSGIRYFGENLENLKSIILENMKLSVEKLRDGDHQEAQYYSILHNSLSFWNGVDQRDLTTRVEIVCVLQSMLDLHLTRLDIPMIKLLYKLYLSMEDLQGKNVIIQNPQLMKYCKKLIYMSSSHEVVKLSIVIEFMHSIVYDYGIFELQKLNLVDISFILIQILTERLANDATLEKNIGIKYNIMGIMGKLMLVDDELFNYLVDDPLLIKMLIDEFLTVNNLKFQQCIAYFLNNLLLSTGTRRFKKCHKFQDFIYIDELSSILSKLNTVLATNDKICHNPDTTESQKNIINLIKVSIFQIFQLLIQHSTPFDKLQIIQYHCFDNLMAVLDGPTNENNQSKLVRISLKSIEQLLEEYIWLIHGDFGGDVRYRVKVPTITHVVKSLLHQYHATSSEEIRNLVRSIMFRLS
ncbi:hypothetical protein DASC09_060610 [Saccharomycopsis crataegensis]|uniref:Uncharacterized protein n=1 Tax=Saccharomycopsis crataegensis TaxID=43959 RepID=A0AAV5QWB0_9ASCO|nr:hypothetical protein DASC09_060610 [Saccharomycopsis crataegensis]